MSEEFRQCRKCFDQEGITLHPSIHSRMNRLALRALNRPNDGLQKVAQCAACSVVVRSCVHQQFLEVHLSVGGNRQACHSS